MSPILVRPVREQLEHDRVIRLLQAKYKRKFEVAINPGNEQVLPVGTGLSPWYPDLVLQSTDKTHKLLGVVEVETTESVNHLEAMSEWGTFSRLKLQFHLYVPLGSVDSARRLCTELQITTTEIWAYQAVGDQIRFTMVHRTPQPGDGATAVAASSASPAPARPSPSRPEREPKAETPAAPRSRPAAAPRPTPPARAASPARSAVARTRTAAPTPARPARRAATAPAAPAPRRPGAAKAKAAPPAPRRAAAKPAPKPASRSSSRATKRR